ncbi:MULTISPECIES: hypothetical protein [Nocardia]|nr:MULTISPECIES: hypothetical protein [Nocardia]
MAVPLERWWVRAVRAVGVVQPVVVVGVQQQWSPSAARRGEATEP